MKRNLVWVLASETHELAKALGVLDEHAGEIQILIDASNAGRELSDHVQRDLATAFDHCVRARELMAWNSEIGTENARAELAKALAVAVRGLG